MVSSDRSRLRKSWSTPGLGSKVWKASRRGEERRETLVIIEFINRGDSTEMILTHELFPTEEIRDQHAQGWEMMMENTFGPAVMDA